MNYEELLNILKQQELDLQFSSFTNEDAVWIGLYLYERAKKENLPITIDITRNMHQLFHLSLPGTSPDNDQWVLRKNRLVNRFQISSFQMGSLLKLQNSTLEKKYNLSSVDYAAHGGSFPIIIKNVGVVGTITVSGLTQAEDHALVIDAISAFLS